jgi:hypothetical protein
MCQMIRFKKEINSKQDFVSICKDNIGLWHQRSKFLYQCANIIVVNGKLYICGGITRSFLNRNYVISSVTSIDVYNKEHDVWEQCSDTVIARHGSLTPEIQVFVSVLKHSTDPWILLNCVVVPPITYIKVPTETVPAPWRAITVSEHCSQTSCSLLYTSMLVTLLIT